MAASSSSGGQISQGFPKGSYGFKMSKKVAELTQVVHMLFTRNHEREVEIDELKIAYEQEIANVVQDARSKIDKLEFQLRELERRRKKEVDMSAGNNALLLKEAQERVESSKRELIDEKKESTQLRDLLTQAHKDLERLKHGSTGVSEDLIRKQKLLDERDKELGKLWVEFNEVEAKLKANNKYADEMKKQMEVAQEDCRKHKSHAEKLNKLVEESNRKVEDSVRKCKQTEEEVKYLKRELNKRQKRDKILDERRPNTAASNGDSLLKYTEDDVERMKKEIDWLRLEIKNREGNFNRVFASFQPVFLNGGAQKTHQDNLQERKMMMVTPSSSFTIGNLSNSSPTPSPGLLGPLNSKRRLPNLTGLEPSVHPMTPGALSSSRPTTRSGSTLRPKETNIGPASNFRLIYTK